MPIKGLTTGVVGRFPTIGKLRKGGKRPESGKAPGQDLKTFRFVNDERPDIVAAFVQAYGNEPALLHVYLPHRALDDNFSAWMEEYVAGGLVHRCDGEMMNIWQTPDGKYSKEPRPCPYATGEKKRIKNSQPGCKAVGRLQVIIPELLAAGFVGEVTLETHSYHDIRSIMECLTAAAQARINNEMGLRGIEFVLRRVETTISAPTDDGKRARRKKWLVRIEPAQDWALLQLQLARGEQYQAPMLTAGITNGDEDDDESETIEAEDVEIPQDFDDDDECQEPEPEQEPEPQPAQQSQKPTMGNGRPWTPEQVKAAILKVEAAEPDNRTPPDGFRGLVVGAIDKWLGGSVNAQQGRHLICEYVFGEKSSTKLNAGQINALNRYLGSSSLVGKELTAMVTHLLKASGQESLM